MPAEPHARAVHDHRKRAPVEEPFRGTPWPEGVPGAVDPKDYVSSCAASCEAHEPAPSRSIDCQNTTVAACTETCVEGVTDLDPSCADCWVESIEWHTASGGCGEWECVCLDGYPSLSLLHCQTECLSTRDRQAMERLAMPEPESRGHLPTSSIESDELLASVAVDGQGDIWASGYDDARLTRLFHLTDDGEVVRTFPTPDTTVPSLQSPTRIHA